MKIFINYRTDDTDDLAGRLHDRMRTEFGSENIFKDVVSLRPGDEWQNTITQTVKSCDIVLALIGKGWLVDGKGQRRPFGNEDMVRYELETAKKFGKVIVPVLVQGAPVPPSSELPDSLKWIVGIHVSKVGRDPHFTDDVVRLSTELRRIRDRLEEQARSQQAQQVNAATEAGSIVCPGCKRVCTRNDRFCDECGTSLWENCPRCNASIPIGQRFCKACGTDVPKIKKADAAFATAKATFTEMERIKITAERLRVSDQLLNDLDDAISQAPEYTALDDLRKRTRELIRVWLQNAGNEALTSRQQALAMHYFRRLSEVDPSSDAAQRVESIVKYREARLAEAASLVEAGKHKAAVPIIAALASEFPEDGEIKQRNDELQSVVARATTLLSGGMRNLRDKRQIIQLLAELNWLESQHVRSPRLTELAEEARRAIGFAEVHIARATTHLRGGNIKAAIYRAQRVLEAIADHPQAIEIAKLAGSVQQKVDLLDEFVSERQWCSANDLVEQLEKSEIAEPRAASLIAKTRTAIGQIDSVLFILLIEVGAFALGLLFALVILYLSVVPSSDLSKMDVSFRYLILLIVFGIPAGAIVALMMTWAGVDDHPEVIRRGRSYLPWQRGVDEVAAEEASSQEMPVIPPVTQATTTPKDGVEMPPPLPTAPASSGGTNTVQPS